MLSICQASREHLIERSHFIFSSTLLGKCYYFHVANIDYVTERLAKAAQVLEVGCKLRQSDSRIHSLNNYEKLFPLKVLLVLTFLGDCTRKMKTIIFLVL